eukprot:Gb_33799 [translate_table: standard]
MVGRKVEGETCPSNLIIMVMVGRKLQRAIEREAEGNMAPGNASVATIDSAFIQSKDHRPKQSYTYYDRVPVIDLSPLQSHSYSDIHTAEKNLEKLVMEVEKACKEWGFFVVINHGVPTDLIRKVRSTAAEFYALPLKEKRKVRRDEQNALGYFDNELTENVRDWREVFAFDAFYFSALVLFPFNLHFNTAFYVYVIIWPELIDMRGLTLMPLLSINPSPELTRVGNFHGVLDRGASPHAMAWHASPPSPRRAVSTIPSDLQRRAPLPSPPTLLRAVAEAAVGHQTPTVRIYIVWSMPLFLH